MMLGSWRARGARQGAIGGRTKRKRSPRRLLRHELLQPEKTLPGRQKRVRVSGMTVHHGLTGIRSAITGRVPNLDNHVKFNRNELTNQTLSIEPRFFTPASHLGRAHFYKILMQIPVLLRVESRSLRSNSWT